MDAEMRVINPNDIILEATFKMSLGKWVNLRKQLNSAETCYGSASPAWEIRRSITEMVDKFEKNFKPTDQQEGE